MNLNFKIVITYIQILHICFHSFFSSFLYHLKLKSWFLVFPLFLEKGLFCGGIIILGFNSIHVYLEEPTLFKEFHKWEHYIYIFFILSSILIHPTSFLQPSMAYSITTVVTYNESCEYCYDVLVFRVDHSELSAFP